MTGRRESHHTSQPKRFLNQREHVNSYPSAGQNAGPTSGVPRLPQHAPGHDVKQTNFPTQTAPGVAVPPYQHYQGGGGNGGNNQQHHNSHGGGPQSQSQHRANQFNARSGPGPGGAGNPRMAHQPNMSVSVQPAGGGPPRGPPSQQTNPHHNYAQDQASRAYASSTVTCPPMPSQSANVLMYNNLQTNNPGYMFLDANRFNAPQQFSQYMQGPQPQGTGFWPNLQYSIVTQTTPQIPIYPAQFHQAHQMGLPPHPHIQQGAAPSGQPIVSQPRPIPTQTPPSQGPVAAMPMHQPVYMGHVLAQASYAHAMPMQMTQRPQREKKIMSIVNPQSGKSIFDSDTTPPATAQESDTSVESSKQCEIRQVFSAEVARKAAEIEQESKSRQATDSEPVGKPEPEAEHEPEPPLQVSVPTDLTCGDAPPTGKEDRGSNQAASNDSSELSESKPDTKKIHSDDSSSVAEAMDGSVDTADAESNEESESQVVSPESEIVGPTTRPSSETDEAASKSKMMTDVVELNGKAIDVRVDSNAIVKSTSSRLTTERNENESSETLVPTNVAIPSVAEHKDELDSQRAVGKSDQTNDSRSSPPPVLETRVQSLKDSSEHAVVDQALENVSEEELKEESAPTNENSDEQRIEPSTKSGSQIRLKYQYNDDQWSPINQSGKKQYHRDFLLQLRNDPISLIKPSDLPRGMEIIKDEPMQIRKIPTSTMEDNGVDFFTPVFSTGYLIKPTISQRGRSREMAKRPVMPPQKIIDVKIQKVELHQTENAWRPDKLKEPVNGEGDHLNDLARKVRSILNKLCPQRFSVLVSRFTELPIDTFEKLDKCIELIFEKAVDEPGFSEAYARMCGVLSKLHLKMKKIDVSSDQQKTPNFQKLILSRCQSEFLKDYMEGLDKKKYEEDLAAATSEEAKREIQSEWEEKERNARKRSIGNIRFIGELFKLDMLTPRAMHECIGTLLNKEKEESLECLCRLMTTVGRELELEAQKPKKDPNSNARLFDNYFDRIESIIKKKTTSSRIRFMLQDLVDMRKNGWKARRDVAGPKTIDQIHLDAEKEKLNQSLLNMDMTSRNRDRDMGFGSGSGSDAGMRKKPYNRGHSQDQDGWAGGTNRTPLRSSNEKFDASILSTIAKKQQTDADNMQLGPGPMKSTWGRGSGGISGRYNSKVDHVTPLKNRYEALNTPGSSTPPHQYEGSSFDTRRGGPSHSIGAPGHGSRGPSADAERLGAVKAVRNNKPNAPMDADKDTSEVGHLVSGPTASMGPPAHGLPVPNNVHEANDIIEQTKKLNGKAGTAKAEAEKSTKMILDDFIATRDEKEAILRIRESFHPSTMSIFISKLIEVMLDRVPMEDSRHIVGCLLNELVTNHILLKSQLRQSICDIVDSSSDLIFDIPKLWEYIADLIAPMMEAGTMPLSMIGSFDWPEDGSNASGKLLALVLRAILHRSKDRKACEKKIFELWVASNMNWKDYIPEAHIKDFVKEEKLAFTLNLIQTEAAVRDKLLSMMTSKTAPEIMHDWIEKNIGEDVKQHYFIRGLVLSFFEFYLECKGVCHFEENAAKSGPLLVVLKRYLVATDVEAGRQAIYALQHLMNRMLHPRDVLYNIFCFLYDNDLVKEESFWSWKNTEDLAEIEGKGVAVKSTNKFFTWLVENDDEENKDD